MGEMPVKYTFADRLFDLKLYSDARVEYERQSSNAGDRNSYLVAVCEIRTGNFENALKLLGEYIVNTSDSARGRRAIIDCASIELCRGNVDNALKYIELGEELGFFLENPLKTDLFALLNENWGAFGIERPRERSSALARISSLILPGSGQAIAGEPCEGLRSAGVNSVLWYLTISGAAGGYWPRALTIFYFFGQRYWLGGSEKAARLAEDFNEKERIAACRKVAGKLEWICCESSQ